LKHLGELMDSKDYDKLDNELKKLEKMGNDIIKTITSDKFDSKEVMNEITVYIKRYENIIKKVEDTEHDNTN
jgi:phosphopantetheine adenylyltransferase